jgi:hypothetical protein
LSINDRNEIAFYANFTTGEGTYESGVWMEEQGALRLIARTGDPLPGLAADTAFSSGWIHRPSARPVALLSAFLTGFTIYEPNSGLWARTASGELLLIAREGELLNVSDDPDAPDMRRIRLIHSAGIDDHGYISFGAFFFDGTSGVFVSSVVAVPEPHAGAFLVFGAVMGFIQFARQEAFEMTPASKTK